MDNTALWEQAAQYDLSYLQALFQVMTCRCLTVRATTQHSVISVR